MMNCKKLRVGVTGGIGSGKSYVCGLLTEKGYPIYSCDDRAKFLMVHDAKLVEEIKALVGAEAYFEDGSLNKKAVAAYLFSDADHVCRINSVVHPRVKDDFLQWAEQQQSTIVFMESAILFESGFDGVVDTVLMIHAPLDIRIKRVMQRDGISEEAALDRVKAQIADEEKLRRSDYVVVNDGQVDLDMQLDDVLKSIKTICV